MKTCTKCEESKSKNGFYKNKAARDGLDGWCKDCRKAWNLKQPKEDKPKKGIRIESISDAYKSGMTIQVRDSLNRSVGAKIEKLYKHFMLVNTGRYTTSLAYRDIGIGKA